MDQASIINSTLVFIILLSTNTSTSYFMGQVWNMCRIEYICGLSIILNYILCVLLTKRFIFKFSIEKI